MNTLLSNNGRSRIPAATARGSKEMFSVVDVDGSKSFSNSQDDRNLALVVLPELKKWKWERRMRREVEQ